MPNSEAAKGSVWLKICTFFPATVTGLSYYVLIRFNVLETFIISSLPVRQRPYYHTQRNRHKRLAAYISYKT